MVYHSQNLGVLPVGPGELTNITGNSVLFKLEISMGSNLLIEAYPQDDIVNINVIRAHGMVVPENWYLLQE